jgi:hypothetical protein
MAFRTLQFWTIVMVNAAAGGLDEDRRGSPGKQRRAILKTPPFLPP